MKNTTQNRQSIGRTQIILFLLLCFGCSGPATLVEYYTLSSLTENPDTAVKYSPVKTGDHPNISIGVGPLTFPKTIDRPHIVTRTGAHTLKVAEFHRWGGSLHEDFLNVLCENLAALLGTQQTESFPWETYFKPRWQVYINVHRFDGVLGEYAQLIVRWRLTNRKSGETVLVRQSEFKEALPGTDYEDFVAAQSRILTAFSRVIVNEIAKLPISEP